MRLVPAVLSCLLLGAHFLRGGRLSMVLVCLVAPFLLVGAVRWRVRAFQVFLGAGVLVWIARAIAIGSERVAAGEPWIRMAFILGGVAAFTAWAAWLAGPRPSRPAGSDPGAAT